MAAQRSDDTDEEQKPKRKAVPDMGRGSREQMFKAQKSQSRKPAA